MRGLLAAVALVGVVAVAVAVDGVIAAAPAEPDAALPARPAASGAWYCAVAPTPEEPTSLVAVAPPSDETAPAVVTLDTYADGAVRSAVGDRLFASGLATHTLDAGADGITARWWDHPAVLVRRAAVSAGGEGKARGVLEGPCPTEPAGRWVVPGATTEGGARASLLLANPFEADATVAVTLTTPDGAVTPALLENVVVPGRSVHTVALNEHAPEQPDLGIVVEALAGRVVVEGVQALHPAIGGVEGHALLAATTQPAATWTVPRFVSDEGDRASWLWLTNPGDEVAVVDVVVHGPSGGTVPPGFDEVVLEPATTQRLDLRGVLADGSPRGGVTVESRDDAPVAASVLTRYEDEDRERTGVTVQLGATAADTSWVVAGAVHDRRRVELQVANPAPAPATVDVALRVGSELLTPAPLQGLEVAPAAAGSVDLTPHLPADVDAYAAFVTVRLGQVVVGARAYDRTGTLDPVAGAGVPQASWYHDGSAPPAHYERGLTARIGTSQGPASEARPDG